jgi:hypothetical protein
MQARWWRWSPARRCCQGHDGGMGPIYFGLHLSCSLLEWPKPFFKRELLASDVDVQQASLCVVINQPVGNPKRKV